jgi:hypothetical protein
VAPAQNRVSLQSSIAPDGRRAEAEAKRDPLRIRDGQHLFAVLPEHQHV